MQFKSYDTEYYVAIGGRQLPVTPSKISTSFAGRNETLELADGLPASLIRTRDLLEISFDFWLPSQLYPFLTGGSGQTMKLVNSVTGKLGIAGDILGNYAEDAMMLKHYLEIRDLHDHIIDSMTNKKPTNFFIARKAWQGFNWDIDVTVEDYTITDDADNGADMLCSIRLRQYRWYSTKILKSDGTVQKTRP